MQVDYVPFVNRMIDKYEGGYGWDKDDPGGPTKYGVTCYDLAEFEGKAMDSMAAWAPLVEAMTLSVADTIYQQKYAAAVQFNLLNVGCDCAVFDFDVNSGSTGIRYAQQVAGVSIDGVLGPLSLAAINKMDPATFVNGLCDARLSFLRGLSTWNRFGTGWNNRVIDLRAYCLGLIKPKASATLYRPKLDRIEGAFAKAWIS